MALSILDGNQSATTLSTILSSGQHITAHTVVSLGTQAITDMRGAVSGSVVSISNFPASQVISGTVTANPTGTQTIAGTVTANLSTAAFIQSQGGIASDNGGDEPSYGVQLGYYDESYKTVNSSRPLPISGTVSLGIQQADDTDPNIKFVPIGFAQSDGGGQLDYWAGVKQTNPLPVYLPSTYSIPAGTNRIGVVTIGAGTVTLGAGTAQIGSVTASISNSVTIASLPAISGTVTANTFALQGTAVTTSNFTSTTASTVLAGFNATREVLTIFNEGAGNLHICAGATCTTIAYQVRLSAGDYYEVPLNQTSLTHSAVFATAGTARVCQVS